MSRLDQLVRTDVDPKVSDSAFKQMLEDHLSTFMVRSTDILELTPGQVVRCRGDFYAILTENSIDRKLFFITMRINGYHSPTDYEGTKNTITIANRQLFETLLQKYKIRLAAL